MPLLVVRTYPICAGGSLSGASGVRVITRVVDYGGLFHDDVLPGHRFADHDHRGFRPDGWVEAGREKLERLRPIADRHGLTPLQLACVWNLAHDPVECVAPTLIQEAGQEAKPIEEKRAELAAFASPALLAALDSEEVAQSVARSLAWASEPGHWVITLADEVYPRLLLEIADPPSLLYARGRVELLQRAALAIVGSRNATLQGEANAQTLARALSEAGLAVDGRGAVADEQMDAVLRLGEEGVDSADGHGPDHGGLAGPGSTIAVLGTGIDLVYPSRNAPLAAEIAERGLLLSEFPLGTAPAA